LVSSVNEPFKITEDVKANVKRFNSLSSRLERWAKRIDRPFYRFTEKAEERHGIKGHVTANVRRWNEKTKSYGEWITVDDHDNLVTNAGKDYFFIQCYQTTGIAANGINYQAVTTTAITPAVGDTTLSGEMTTLGFSRAQGTYAHTVATNTCTITTTFTATGAATNVQAGGLFSAASAGTMGHEFTFTATTFATNDQLQLIVTVTYT